MVIVYFFYIYRIAAWLKSFKLAIVCKLNTLAATGIYNSFLSYSKNNIDINTLIIIKNIF